MNRPEDPNNCAKSMDVLVDNYNNCPAGYFKIRDPSELGNPNDLIGMKCCFKLTNFDSNFWKGRYVGGSTPCTELRDDISDYLSFYKNIADKDFGVINNKVVKFYEVYSYINAARKDLNKLNDPINEAIALFDTNE